MKDINFPQPEASMPRPSKGMIIDFDFHDLDLLIEVVRSWDLHFKQLERGNLHSRLKQVIFPEFQLGFCSMDKQIDQMGTSPPGYWTFAFATGSRIIWRGVEKQLCDIIIYQPGMEINCQSWSGFNVATLSIHEQRMREICEFHELGHALKIIRENDLVHADETAMRGFRKQLMTLLNDFPEGLNELPPGLMDTCCAELPRQLFEMIEGPSRRKYIASSFSREVAVKQVVEFLKQSDSDTVTISDLCRVAGVSERTLQYAFKERYGLSPKQYLKTFLMNKVHLALSRANPGNTKVVDLAYQYGFWHPGQFSQDYKAMFGCLPSFTLNKAMS